MKPILSAVLLLATAGVAAGQQTKPISYGLVLDNSKSSGHQFDQIVQAAQAIVSQNEPADETFIVRFIDSDKIEVVDDFTSDKNRLLVDLAHLYTEFGQTALVDAVFLAGERAASRVPASALILITDGDDRHSFYKADHLLSKLREHHVRVYVIGLVNELDNKAKKRSIKLLQMLGDQTNGLTFFLESPAEIPGVTFAIVRSMRAQ